MVTRKQLTSMSSSASQSSSNADLLLSTNKPQSVRDSATDESDDDETPASSCVSLFSFPSPTAVNAMVIQYFFSFVWLELVFYFLFALASATICKFVIPLNQRPIPYQIINDSLIKDFSLNNPYTPNKEVTIPDVTLGLIAIIGPIVALVVMSNTIGVTYNKTINSSQDGFEAEVVSSPPIGDTHKTMCMYFFTVGLSEFVTDGLKRYIGRLRPNFYSMCEFDEVSRQCMSTLSRIEQSRKSFPSGHSSLSFSSLCLVSFYALRQIRFYTLQNRKEAGIGRLSNLLSLALVTVFTVSPLLLASWVAASRIRDFWHHPSDVIAGIGIGSLSAIYGFGLWFPKSLKAVSREGGRRWAGDNDGYL